MLDPCLGEVSDGELAAFCELAGACLQHDGWRRPRMTEAAALLGQVSSSTQNYIVYEGFDCENNVDGSVLQGHRVL